MKDNDRALVWIDGLFSRIFGPGQHVLWTGEQEIKTEVIDARDVRLIHDELPVICGWSASDTFDDSIDVQAGHSGVCFLDSEFKEVLSPGRSAF